MSNCVPYINELNHILTSNNNNECVDCNCKEVEFVSIEHGLFICELCGIHHQQIMHPLKRVSKSYINIHTWSEDDVLNLKNHGNNISANQLYEAELPLYYRRPWPGSSCPTFLRKCFIFSKYVYEEFKQGANKKGIQNHFACSFKSGILLKKLRGSSTFCERYFELSIEENFLRYFVKSGDLKPKQSLDLEKMNITFVTDIEIDVPPHTALIQFIQDYSTRHIFIRSDDPEVIINWYNIVRLAKYHRLCLSLSGMGSNILSHEICANITKDLDYAGWLSKPGPRKRDFWHRRWCMLFSRHFLYTEQPLNAFSKGELFIGSDEEGFSITADLPKDIKQPQGFPFTIHTSERQFLFSSETEEQRDKWVFMLQNVIKIPLTLDERKQAAIVNIKRTSNLDYLK